MDRSNHIILVSSEFPPLPGGIGTHALALANGFTEEGATVIVLTNSRDTIAAESAFDRSLPFTVVRVARRFLMGTYFFRIVALFQLLQKTKSKTLLASGKFSLWMGASVTFFYPALQTFAIIHGSELNAGGSISRYLTRNSLKRFRVRIAVSTYTKQQLIKVVPHLPVTVITNGVVLPFLKFPNPTNKRLNLVTVGNVTPRKGQHNVIQALPLLKEVYPHIHYHVIGLPTTVPQLRQLANELHVGTFITFEGLLSEEEKWRRLSTCQLFMMLSEHLPNGDFEGFGIAVLEANALGIPAIGSKNSGIADAIRDGVTGILVDPHDTQAIKKAIDEIIADYDIYSKRAKAWAIANQWPQVIRQYQILLDA